MIRVLLAEDQPVTRAGIRDMLETAADAYIVGEAESSEQIQNLVASLHPDVVLLDLAMSVCRVFDIVEWIHLNAPEVATLILSANQDDKFLAQALKYGAQGYLSKSEGFSTLLDCIRRAVAGELLFTDEQFERAERWNRQAGRLWDALSERERQVLMSLMHGRSSGEIAETLGVSVKAVEYHVTNLNRKLGVESRMQAVAWFCEHRPDQVQSGDCEED
ncbi:MAG: response regulator [Chloroflexota bacterium]